MKPWKSQASRENMRVIQSFNGATAMKPWKSAEIGATAQVQVALQWGHGDEAVEECLDLLG